MESGGVGGMFINHTGKGGEASESDNLFSMVGIRLTFPDPSHLNAGLIGRDIDSFKDFLQDRFTCCKYDRDIP